MPRLKAGVAAPAQTLHAADGTSIAVPDPSHLLHLHFSRFADCPICNMRIAEMRRRASELTAAGVRQVAVFHSPAEHVREYRADMPFALVADPERAVYERFGVGSSPRALLHPRAIRRLTAERRAGNTAQEAHGGVHGLPADFLIAPDGRLLLAHYGRHADDNMPIQRVLDAVSGAEKYAASGQHGDERALVATLVIGATVLVGTTRSRNATGAGTIDPSPSA